LRPLLGVVNVASILDFGGELLDCDQGDENRNTPAGRIDSAIGAFPFPHSKVKKAVSGGNKNQ
jgi:hypothetical protein